ncbi:hypothetical protein BBP40_002103 [Aspergillus hancockii]|nr:hypothetical protein BBP40_002103 [Aspergillus hancockii]
MDVERLQEALSEDSDLSLTSLDGHLSSAASTVPSLPASPLPFYHSEDSIRTDENVPLPVTRCEPVYVSEFPLWNSIFPSSAAAKTTADILRDIEHKHDVYFAAMKDVVLPLVGEEGCFYQDIVDSVGHINASVQPYKALKLQPAGLRASLKPYQLSGLSFLVHLRNNGIGGILGDEMGLGKTVQALALLQYVKEIDDIVRYDKPTPFLVVCPLSVMETWLSEISKWTPGLTFAKFHGTPGQKEKVKKLFTAPRKNTGNINLVPVVDIVVTSYETLIADIKWFRKFVWRYIVLDEGHRIKNNQSKRAQVLQGVRSEFKLILTGTPVQNDLRELWSIFHWLYPDVFAPSTAKPFEKAFSLGEGKFDPVFFEHVKRFLGLIMLRRVKGSPEVGLAIPQKTETVLSVPLSEFQRSLYLRILTGVDSLLDECDDTPCKRGIQMSSHQQSSSYKHREDDSGDGLSKPFLEKIKEKKKYRILSNILMEMRKCSIHPYLLEDAIPDPYELGQHIIVNSGKFIVLLKMIQHFVVAQGKKIIIFSSFIQTLNLCEDLLLILQRNGNSFRHVRLDGDTSSAGRRLSTYLFQNDPRYMVFLISIRAGGEGLNLESSSTAIFLDEDWNPQVMRQAEARVHRIGQKQPVSIFKLQSTGTVEEQISRRIAKKAYVASKVMEDVHAIRDTYALASMINPQGHSYVMDTEDLSALINSRARLTSGQLNTTQLAWFDWKAILDLCTTDRIEGVNMEAAVVTAHQEMAWLACSERVKTNIFDGKRVDTRFRSLSKYETLPENLCRAERRIGKERTVIIDGFEVSKYSIELESPKSPSRPEAGVKMKMTHEVVSSES